MGANDDDVEVAIDDLNYSYNKPFLSLFSRLDLAVDAPVALTAPLFLCTRGRGGGLVGRRWYSASLSSTRLRNKIPVDVRDERDRLR